MSSFHETPTLPAWVSQQVRVDLRRYRCIQPLICRSAGGGAGAAGVVTGMDAAMEEEREAARRGAALERRRWRKDEKEQLDELVPKATGRCALSHDCRSDCRQHSEEGCRGAA